ncbi:MAG: BCCT family transporter [Thermodesulfobacteriota bacterium]|nr:BCCT family transporter [Thermodesulfobacteriota bacterium]
MTDQTALSDGQTSAHRFFDIHPPVFWPAALLAIAFIAVTLLVGDPMETVFSTIQRYISDNFGWFLVLSVNLYLAIMLLIAFSKFGDIRLGGNTAVPDFSRLSWFAMLFSAGMGIGILFWSVAEPVYHFTDPPYGSGTPQDAAAVAMKTTFLHWGLHPWGIYALVGMALAFFTFNRGLPLAIRSIFHPLMGDRIHGIWGDLIDVVAVLATLFGLATSLGFGVQQVSAGLHHLFGLPDTIWMQVLLVAAITLAATLSVVSGIDHGVKRLSELNLGLGALMLLFILILGPTVAILDAFIQNTGTYLQSFFTISFWTESYRDTTWQNNWTVFYWAWWISWSPFVGMFIARISRGRTVREFVLSVLIIPSLLTFLWITAFGGSALFVEMQAPDTIAGPVKENVAVAIYYLLEQFPLGAITSFAAVILVISFFVTSSDSGSLVVDAFTSGGKLNSPIGQRIFWAGMEGTVAAVLLIGGGLGALQTASITTGLPFAALLIIMGYSLWKGLNAEYEKTALKAKAVEQDSYQDLIKQLISEKTDAAPAHSNPLADESSITKQDDDDDDDGRKRTN